MTSYKQMNDEALLRAYVEQTDREALGALFQRHADAAYSTAMRICRNAADAEDSVQAAFVKAMANAAAYRGGTEQGVRYWLIKIVIGTCKDKIRGEVRRRRREEVVGEEQDEIWVPDETERQETDLRQQTDEVLKALDELSERHRSAIWLHLYVGMSRQDAAAALNVSERTLDNQIQYGLGRIRQRLAERNIAAGAASIAAVIPLLPAEAVPAPLADSIGSIVAGTFKVSRSAVGGKPGFGGLFLKIAATGIILCGIAAAVKYLVPGATQTPGHAARQAVTVDYRWDFNAPGVPEVFKPVVGTLKHVQSGGSDGKGCLQVDGDETEVRLDVPLATRPLVVEWQSSAIIIRDGQEWLSKTFWLPATNMAQFLDIGKWFSETGVRDNKTRWFNHKDYYTDSYVDRWTDGYRQDFTVAGMDPAGRISLISRASHQIDNLVIRSISSNDLPDASEYLEELAKIPKDKRRGCVPVYSIKASRPGTNVTVWFYDRVDHFVSPHKTADQSHRE